MGPRDAPVPVMRLFPSVLKMHWNQSCHNLIDISMEKYAFQNQAKFWESKLSEHESIKCERPRRGAGGMLRKVTSHSTQDDTRVTCFIRDSPNS